MSQTPGVETRLADHVRVLAGVSGTLEGGVAWNRLETGGRGGLFAKLDFLTSAGKRQGNVPGPVLSGKRRVEAGGSGSEFTQEETRAILYRRVNHLRRSLGRNLWSDKKARVRHTLKEFLDENVRSILVRRRFPATPSRGHDVRRFYRMLHPARERPAGRFGGCVDKGGTWLPMDRESQVAMDFAGQAILQVAAGIPGHPGLVYARVANHGVVVLEGPGFGAPGGYRIPVRYDEEEEDYQYEDDNSGGECSSDLTAQQSEDHVWALPTRRCSNMG
ncbi:hypothetical protein DFJ77DRAFT_538699 [Powellomyces hirtus]|nr:hypothetical protein DFJ77DRAFT_538699 [Powellomyces hirtus]